VSVKDHYKNLLGNYYSWMIGDFETKQQEFLDFLVQNEFKETKTGCALDLGAGNGIQSVALLKLGYQVIAIDFNPQLLEELRINSLGKAIDIVEGDILEFKNYTKKAFDVIVCSGDTIAHLPSLKDLEILVSDIVESLAPGGRVILSFRDYTNALKDENRFIPVKSDDSRIAICFLEYEENRVKVSDVLYEKSADGWVQKVSQYYKIRIFPSVVEALLIKHGLTIKLNRIHQRMNTIIAEK
jgi:SAM-dependent methyltransferase